MVLPNDEVRQWRGLALQEPAAALIDALAWWDKNLADSAFCWAVVTGQLPVDRVAGLILMRRGKRQVVRLRHYFTMLQSGAALELELRFHNLLRQANITGWRPNVKITLADGMRVVVDIYFEHSRTVVELDGKKWHFTAQAFESDRLRDNALHAAGYRTMRVTWDMIERNPNQVLATLRALIDSDLRDAA